MKPLVLFSSLAVLCAGGLMALSYKGLHDDPSALTSLSPESQTVNIKPAEAVSNPPAAQQSAETAPAPAPKAEEAAKAEQAPEAEEKVAAVEPKQTETAPSAEPVPEVKLGDETAQPETGEAKIEGASFDIVRVEEDGSAVLAGRAEPGAKVRLLINQKIAGETLANDRGEWVVIPAEAMPAGAHQMQIETENAAGEVKLAEQSVALTVPDKPGTQPLIVLSETAKPSKVLQKPETAQVVQDEVKQADAGQTAENTADSDQQPAAESKTAALQPPATAAAPAADPSGRTLNVDVVDYNEAGLTTFSGRSAPNTTVRVYVDDVYTGAAVSGNDGTWSFTADREIAAGPHRLRTDQIAQDGSVSERIELPFFRESAERIASLQAQRQTAAEQQQVESEAQPTAAPEPATAAKDAEEPATSTEIAKAEPGPVASETAESGVPETEPSASAPATTGTESAEPQVAEAQPTSDIKSDAETTKPADAPASTEPQATQQIAAAETSAAPAGAETGGQAAAPGTSAESAGQETAAEPAKPETAQQQIAAVETDAEPVKPADLLPATEDDEPIQEVVEPEPNTTPTETAAVSTGTGQADSALPATGRVVIQPGNNLWNISRVIYGQGRQYTVIYDANKDQIRDPDRIYPGQIFDTPGSNAPESIDPACRRPLAECE